MIGLKANPDFLISSVLGVRDFSCAFSDFTLSSLWYPDYHPLARKGKIKKVSLLNALLRARQLWRLFLVLTENELIVVKENCIHGEEFIIIEGVNWLFFWISLVGNKHVI